MAEPVSKSLSPTADEERLYREGVMLFLAFETRLATIEEIVTHQQAFYSSDCQKEIREGTELAIRDLAAMGVLNVEGRSVYISRAAREGARLLDGDSDEIEPW